MDKHINYEMVNEISAAIAKTVIKYYGPDLSLKDWSEVMSEVCCGIALFFRSQYRCLEKIAFFKRTAWSGLLEAVIKGLNQGWVLVEKIDVEEGLKKEELNAPTS